MGIGFVLMIWSVPALLGLAICYGILTREGREFRKRKPLAFFTTIGIALAAMAPAVLILAGSILLSSNSPGAGYRSIFHKDAGACIHLLKGETSVSTDIDIAHVTFISTCADTENELERFNLKDAPAQGRPYASERAEFDLTEDDCTMRQGETDEWRRIEVMRCPAKGLYIIDASWID